MLLTSLSFCFLAIMQASKHPTKTLQRVGDLAPSLLQADGSQALFAALVDRELGSLPTGLRWTIQAYLTWWFVPCPVSHEACIGTPCSEHRGQQGAGGGAVWLQFQCCLRDDGAGGLQHGVTDCFFS